jgi:sulfate adenylyltransferase subunit 1 (EFTu-like GTPase family)
MKEQNTELLRFTTAGSVDDGKSTLIGRLLYDSKSILKTNSIPLKRRPNDEERRALILPY